MLWSQPPTLTVLCIAQLKIKDFSHWWTARLAKCLLHLGAWHIFLRFSGLVSLFWCFLTSLVLSRELRKNNAFTCHQYHIPIKSRKDGGVWNIRQYMDCQRCYTVSREETGAVVGHGLPDMRHVPRNNLFNLFAKSNFYHSPNTIMLFESCKCWPEKDRMIFTDGETAEIGPTELTCRTKVQGGRGGLLYGSAWSRPRSFWTLSTCFGFIHPA